MFTPGTARYSGPDRINGSASHQHAVPIPGDPGRVFVTYQVQHGETPLLVKRLITEAGEIRTRDPKPMVRHHLAYFFFFF